jgi:rubrerythrin
MATGETGFTDIAFDLVSIQYHALKAGHDYGQYVRDAENAGQDEVAAFFRQVQEEDQNRGSRCSELLKKLAEEDHAGPQAAS